MNVEKLRALMVLHDDNITTLARKMGISRSTLSAKMNGRRDWLVPDVMAITRIYALGPELVESIFFAGYRAAAAEPVGA